MLVLVIDWSFVPVVSSTTSIMSCCNEVQNGLTFWQQHTQIVVETGHYLKRLKGPVKEPNMFHSYETEKITCKASDVAENLQL